VIVDVPQFLTLREQLPFVDVRSEGEFQSGHIPNAINIPILNNSERVVVGTTYKQQGQRQAILEGFRLVGPRLIDIIQSTEQIGRELIVHCWRGGMRSGNFCQFVGMAGVKTHQLKGGYKAYRQFASAFLEKPFRFIVLTGLTGSGKTDILKGIRDSGEQVVDLEGLASHKGSAFGGLGQGEQPSSEQFLNDLFEVLLKMDTSRPIWIEDESIAVGKIFIPAPFWSTMSASPVVCVDVPKSVRIERLVKEYGDVDREGFATALKGITKKLGGQHYNEAVEKLKVNDMHQAIDIILNYYDKAYATGLARKRERIRFTIPWDGSSVHEVASELIVEARRHEIGTPASKEV
jgi:tRNA 2-selenouridine synthase